MLTSALRALVKKINIEIMHWKLVKSGMFNFMKVKKLVFLMKIFYFLFNEKVGVFMKIFYF